MPFGDASNRAASDAFVQQALAGTPASSITVGVTAVGGGTNNCVFYDLAGLLACSTTLPNGLAMGTPASITLTNGTGLPIAGLAGLAAGIGTWLATPSSANLAAALSDETGSGSAVFANNSTIQPRFMVSEVNVSQFTGADWCAKLVSAIAAVGVVPALFLIDGANMTINACTAGADISLGNDHEFYFTSGNIFTLNQRLVYGSYGTLLRGLGGGDQGNPPIAHGTVLKWSGATGAAMIYMFGTAFSSFSRLGIDCNGTSNCIGIHMNSNNSPITTRNVLRQFEITGTHVGIVIGSAATSATSPATCSGAPSTDGCSENDVFLIQQFQIFGTCGDTTAEGIRINSLNAAQLSRIEMGNIQCVNIGVNVINMNDNLVLANMAVGSPFGTSPTQFVIGSGVVNGPDIIDNDCEGSITCINDQATAGSQIWSNNQFNTAVSTTGGATIISQSNIYNSLTVGGTVKMTSIGDSGAAPSFSGSGKYIKAGYIAPGTVAALPSCVAGRQGQSQYVTDANATTFNAVVAGGGANILRVGCDGTSWRIGG